MNTDNLVLRHVLAMHRHGERTPVTPYVSDNLKMDMEVWRQRLCTDEIDDLNRAAKVVGPTKTSSPHVYPIHDGDKGLLGHLTHQGTKTMREQGRKLRERYDSFIHVTSDEEPDDIVHIVSSSVPRTIQSVQALLHGCFPELIVNQSSTPPFHIHTYERNVLAPQHPTSDLFKIETMLQDEIAKRSDSEKEANAKLKKLLQTQLHLPEDQPFVWTLIRDTLRCNQAHGEPFPDGITDQVFKELEAYDSWLWKGYYQPREACAKYFADGVKEIYRHLENAVNRSKAIDAQTPSASSPAPRLTICSAHDNSLVALSYALQLQVVDSLPDYGDMAVFEVYEDVTTRAFYVKVTFADKETTFSAYPSSVYCPFETFQGIVQTFVQTQTA